MDCDLSSLGSWNLRTPLAATLAHFAAAERFHLNLAYLLAHRIAKLRDPIAKGGGPLEFECVGGGQHLGLQRVNVLVGNELRVVPTADRRVRLAMRRRFRLDARANVLLDRLG